MTQTLSAAFRPFTLGPATGMAMVACRLLAAEPAGAMEQAVATKDAAPRPLAGEELRRVIAGKRVFLAVPLGGEFPLYYRGDGRVDGTGEAVGLGRVLKPRDSGRWWITGEKLCQKWETWYDGRVFCFTVTPRGPGRIAWLRDDGEQGVARIAD